MRNTFTYTLINEVPRIKTVIVTRSSNYLVPVIIVIIIYYVIDESEKI